MAEYHYKYDHPHDPLGPDGNYPAPAPAGGGDDSPGWLLILIALISVWPIGLLLLFRKLMKISETSAAGIGAAARSAAQNAARSAQNAARSAATQTKAAPTGRVRAKSPVPASTGRGMIVGGAVLAGMFGLPLAIVSLLSAVTGWSLNLLFAQMVLASFAGSGLVLLAVGTFRHRQARIFRHYLSLIGQRRDVSISALARATGRRYKKVCAELQNMLDLGILPTGYLDLAEDRLILSAQGIDDEPAPAQKSAPKADDNAVLTEIRAVNDAISDPVMSAKIDRIGEITGKILDYQRQHPDQAGELRAFLNYYLPTTLKILRAYAQLEGQGVEGENISATKKRVESMMDKVVEGFEKQLDRLFQDSAMDIASDVAVLEQMLDKDGLGSQGMTLGG